MVSTQYVTFWEGAGGEVSIAALLFREALNYGQGVKIECDPCFGQGWIFSALAK